MELNVVLQDVYTWVFVFFQYVKIFIVLLHTSYKVYKSTICVDILTWGNSVKFDDEMRRHAYDLHLVEW